MKWPGINQSASATHQPHGICTRISCFIVWGRGPKILLRGFTVLIVFIVFLIVGIFASVSHITHVADVNSRSITHVGDVNSRSITHVADVNSR